MITAETEIWPNFLRACSDRHIPVVMINGRISDRSFSRYLLVRRWLSRVFADYTIMGMQSEMDRARRIDPLSVHSLFFAEKFWIMQRVSCER